MSASGRIIDKYIIGQTDTYPGEFSGDWPEDALALIWELAELADELETRLKEKTE
ncbi:MAG: hypothetical protein ACRD1K_20585 [Acidimicrobiales bacterium]